MPAAARAALEDMMQHNPKRIPAVSSAPRECIFYGRVCATLRKSLAHVGPDGFSVVDAWHGRARAALVALASAGRKLDSC